MRPSLRLLPLVVVILLLGSSEARADLLLALDVNGGAPLGDGGDDVGSSVGLGGRLGYTLPIPLLRVTPELVGEYISFPADPPDIGNADQGVVSVMGGLRVGLSTLIAPSLYAHVGYGWLSGEGSDFTINHDGPALDLGVAVDFTLLPLVELGLHVGYQWLSYESNNSALPDSLQWVEAGAHAELSF